MELLDGMDLETLVRHRGPLPAGRVIHILRQVCESLEEAHARGLVHRDIKPANIFTCRMGLEVDVVKVLDFGLVKAQGDGARQERMRTAPNATAGTPAFIAPEVAQGETAIDHRVDIYALGCVAYWLLTGQLVFEARNAMQQLLLHIRQAPVPPSGRMELPIPAALDDRILVCLAKQPATGPRPQPRWRGGWWRFIRPRRGARSGPTPGGSGTTRNRRLPHPPAATTSP
jgi:serine/threonine-protein kinase